MKIQPSSLFLRLVRAPADELPPAAPERVAIWMLAAHTLFVTYGCLYPFEFSIPGRKLLAWPQVAMLGDVVANLSIYGLLGFIAFSALLPTRPAWQRGAATAAFCILLSLSIEIAQAFDAGRHSSLLDVIVNPAGALAGAAAAAMFREAGFRQDLDPGMGVGGALLLLALWFACRLTPFIASIDLQQIGRALAPLGNSWRPYFTVVFHLAVLWLVVFRVIAVLAPRRRPVLAGLAVALALALLRMIVRGQTISPQEVYAVALAAFAFALGFRRAGMIAAALFTALLLEALAPYVFGAGRRMNLLPFRPFIRGGIEPAMQVLLLKCFSYGGLAWLLLHARLRASIVIAGGGAAILALEALQQFVPGRYPDITDPVIFVALALAIRHLDRLDLRRGPAPMTLGGDARPGVQSLPQQGGS